ncbi:MAG: hypothetical protein ACP5EN_01670 [Rhodovulum sp.]
MGLSFKPGNRASLSAVAVLGIMAGLAGCGPQVKGMAAVSADAALIRGVNVVSVTKQAPGYRVEFASDVDVANGYYLVTPGLTGSCNTMINAEKTTGNAVYVSFAGRGPGINFADCAFSLAVY